MELLIDPEFKKLIRPLTQDERQSLEDSLLKDGCRDALVVWGETIIDGHNRYEICTEHGIEFKVERKDFGSTADVKRWMILNQMARRNLTREELKDFRGKYYATHKQEHGTNRHTTQSGKDFHSRTREILADKFNVTDRTIQNDYQYTQNLDAISEVTGEDVRHEITSRQLPATDKDVKKLAEMAVKEPETAKKIVEKVKKGEASSIGKAIVEQKKQQRAQQLQEHVESLDTKKTYRIIYADPPWKYNEEQHSDFGNVQQTVLGTHYPSMSIQELCQLPVKDIVQDDAVLFMWVTSPLLEECFPIIKAWGFKYKTSMVWDKVKHNVGNYVSVRHELLLICTRGSCTPDNRKLHDSVQSIERTEHSRKPEEFRQIIDDIYRIGNRVELFRRGDSIDNWDTWGNEANG